MLQLYHVLSLSCFHLTHQCLSKVLWRCVQRHLARTAGRWKDSPWKNAASELQDELMSVRLREAEAQAELREIRQRMLELETQVSFTYDCSSLLYMCWVFMRRPVSKRV